MNVWCHVSELCSELWGQRVGTLTEAGEWAWGRNQGGHCLTSGLCISFVPKEERAQVLTLGALDEEALDRFCKNIGKAYKQEGKIPVSFWVIRALIWTVIKILKEDKYDKNPDEEMTNSLNEYKLEN